MDRSALRPLPERPYIVSERQLREVGKDCLVSFEASCHPASGRRVLPRMAVELRVTRDQVAMDRWRSGLWPRIPSASPLVTENQVRERWFRDQTHK
ncbi:MAG: hypothetical protein M3396_10570, partial [Actinomycetota bacterium]|nr:hypothetical protein [Actinomycetota bacterium]